MRTLSKEAEQSVIEAVKRAVALVDDERLQPTAAIEKVARHQKWGAEMIRFACSAYNTGRQTAQREQAETALEKFAQFPLADADAVIAGIFPPDVVKAAAAKAYEGVSPEYRRPPQWLAKRAALDMTSLHRSWREKVASAQAPVEQPKTAEDCYNKYLKIKRAAEDARYVAGVAYDQLLGAMGRLADYFKRAACDRVPFGVAEVVAAANYKQAGAHLMNWVYARNRMRETRADQTKFASLIEIDPDLSPWNLIQQCISLGERVAEKRAGHEVAAEALEKYVTGDEFAPLVSDLRYKQADWSLVPQPDVRVADNRTLRAFIPHLQKRSAKTAQASATTPEPVQPWTLLTPVKSASFGDAATASGTRALLDKALSGNSERMEHENSVRDVWRDLEDPTHEADLRRIRSQALISDLMNDEVIGGYGHDRVLKAYNEISQMAPRVANQPMPIRSLLRRHLQGNVEPFEAKEVTDIEKGLKETANPPPPQPQPSWAGGAGGKTANTRILNDGDTAISII